MSFLRHLLLLVRLAHLPVGILFLVVIVLVVILLVAVRLVAVMPTLVTFGCLRRRGLVIGVGSRLGLWNKSEGVHAYRNAPGKHVCDVGMD